MAAYVLDAEAGMVSTRTLSPSTSTAKPPFYSLFESTLDGERVEVRLYRQKPEDDENCKPSAKMGQIGAVEIPRVLGWCELLE